MTPSSNQKLDCQKKICNSSNLSIMIDSFIAIEPHNSKLADSSLAHTGYVPQSTNHAQQIKGSNQCAPEVISAFQTLTLRSLRREWLSHPAGRAKPRHG